MGAANASAQAKKTATRSVDLSAFAGFTYENAAYDSPSNIGLTFGADYTQFIKRLRGLIIPSFELRGTFTPGSTDSEKTVEGGLKLATTFKRLHPYGDFLYGGGIITFPVPANAPPTYRRRDSSETPVYGGGITYDVRPNWSAMVDFQQQNWNFHSKPPAAPDLLTPQLLTFGIVYHIPFKAYKTY
ncbi:hypothetical protein [Granulicella arctica]|uniref:Outer membrane protein beta-barrel domain-containing protein n=1 Tax=Granulicella arctica TaxID=940613 RepID=A0A7Y9PDW2_9BACT|nr:hypothetical protein [Granulicella arctica]NYF78128.1 hypothetical protein [Granulicella arctica]